MNTCPSCGYCPHCGRSAHPYVTRPYWQVPSQPYVISYGATTAQPTLNNAPVQMTYTSLTGT